MSACMSRSVSANVRLFAICGARVRVARTMLAYPRTVEGDRSAARDSTKPSKASASRGLSTSSRHCSANSLARRIQRRRSGSVKEYDLPRTITRTFQLPDLSLRAFIAHHRPLITCEAPPYMPPVSPLRTSLATHQSAIWHGLLFQATHLPSFLIS